MISGHAKLAGVIGWPVSHSLSPKLHNYWLEQYGIDGAYLPLAVRPGDLASVIRALPAMGFRGANLTIPHKEAVIPLLDSIDDTARAIGAVNTIVIEGDKIHGTNTDAYGFMENIRPHLTGKGKAILLGAGGAAKAICHALLAEGFSHISIINRTEARAQALAAHFGGRIDVQKWDKRSGLLEGADLLVNTTSLGLSGKEALDIDLEALPKTALVTDIVYNPLITPLLETAKANGNPVVDGLGMLIHQAVPGFDMWFGTKPDVTAEVRQHLTA